MKMTSRVPAKKRQPHWLVVLVIGSVLFLNGVKAENRTGTRRERDMLGEDSTNEKKDNLNGNGTRIPHGSNANILLNVVSAETRDDANGTNDKANEDDDHHVKTNGNVDKVDGEKSKDGTKRQKGKLDDAKVNGNPDIVKEVKPNRDDNDGLEDLVNGAEAHGKEDAVNGDEDMLRIDDHTAISKQDTVAKLSSRIRAIVEHYQQEDPVGLPDTRIPDPLPVPDLVKSSMTFERMQVYGLSQFRIVKVHTDLPGMEITMGILIVKLEILGNYSLSQWWSTSHGQFNVTLLNVYIEGKASLLVNEAGKLEADRVHTDARVESIKLDFQNLSVLGSVVQGILNSAGSFLFDSLKPQMLQEFNVKLVLSMNEHLKAMNHSFEPRAGLPIDAMIRTVRNTIRDRQIDPYHVEIGSALLNNSVLRIDQFVLHGLSTFYRIGDISLHMENKSLSLSLHVGIPVLKGRLSWELSYVTRSQTCFSLKYLQLRIIIRQAINDLTQSPQLERIQVKLGSIKLSKYYSKASLAQHLIQTYVYNVLPNVLRLQIINLMQQPLHNAIQSTLDQVKLNDYLSLL